MFIDEARITVRAGNGGHGCIAFRREKFVPKGGPSGGDGGNGGDIYLVSDSNENTLLKFRFNHTFDAERGQHGMGSNWHGKQGVDMEIRIPRGTMVYDNDSGELLHDFASDTENERVRIAKGGRGGFGNSHYKTATNRAPKKAQDGVLGERRVLRLELKLLADVGLVGFPNAGKSTLISRISAARPKIADYPFTTLEPNLGVVSIGASPDEKTFVVADIPGLIEGAHLGAGLGVQFLRHIDRTKLLLHLIDVSQGTDRDPVESYHTIQNELAQHNPELPLKASVIAATKIDTIDMEKLSKLQQWCGQNHVEMIKISSVTGEGLEELKRSIYKKLSSQAADQGTE